MIMMSMTKRISIFFLAAFLVLTVCAATGDDARNSPETGNFNEETFQNSYNDDSSKIDVLADDGESEVQPIRDAKDIPTDEFKLVLENVLDEKRVLSPYYDLSFDIKPFGKVKGWASITLLGSNDKTHFQLAVMFIPNTLQLYVCTNIAGRQRCWISPTDLPLDTFSQVRIAQQIQAGKLFYMVFLNGEQKYSVENTKPDFFLNVKIHAGAPFYAPANAVLKNYKLVTKPSELLMRGHLLEQKPVLSANYDLSFDIMPFGKMEKFGNIIHLTTGGNNGRFGDRTPAVWFFYHSTLLMICSAINGNRNYCWSPTVELPFHKFSNIRIQQRSDIKGKTTFTISIDGKQQFVIENTTPQNFTNVRVYNSDPWYLPAKAVLKNYKLVNLP